LAEYLRATRKRSAVPALASVLWYGVAMGISIGRANTLDDSDGYDLALGLLMSWLPVLVACAIVDRYPTSSSHVRQALQRFLDSAAAAASAQASAKPCSRSDAGVAAKALYATSRGAVLPFARQPLKHDGPNDGRQGPAALSGDCSASSAVSAEALSTISPAHAAVFRTSDLSGNSVAASATMADTLSPLRSPQEAEQSQQSCLASGASDLQPPFSAPATTTAHMHLPSQVKAPHIGAFCGQGRRKWHRGVSSPLLHFLETQADVSDIALSARLHFQSRPIVTFPAQGVAAKETAAVALVRFRNRYRAAQDESTSNSIDSQTAFSMALQGLVACLVLGLSTSGAVIISYFAHTLGLGCRSGNYIIYGALAFSSFALEMTGWVVQGTWQRRRRRQPRSTDTSSVLPRHFGVVLTVLEVVSFTELLTILLGQPTGLYNSCACRGSLWSPIRGVGGYVTFSTREYDREHFEPAHFRDYGTAIGCLPLLVAFYAAYAWCTQSFLWSDDSRKALRGLRRVRRARYLLGGLWYEGFVCVVRCMERTVARLVAWVRTEV
jgi:hypothetical protein